jgi:hypothetical protein
MRWLLVPKLKAYIASIPGLPGREVSIALLFRGQVIYRILKSFTTNLVSTITCGVTAWNAHM